MTKGLGWTFGLARPECFRMHGPQLGEPANGIPVPFSHQSMRQEMMYMGGGSNIQTE